MIGSIGPVITSFYFEFGEYALNLYAAGRQREMNRDVCLTIHGGKLSVLPFFYPSIEPKLGFEMA